MERMDWICPDMLADKQVLLISDHCTEVSDVAACFKAAGCRVAVSFFNDEGVAPRLLPEAVQVFPGSLTCEEDIVRLGDQVRVQFAEPDILLVFTRRYGTNALQRINEKTWMHDVELPLRMTYLCCRSFSEAMVKNGWGRIILISAVQAKTGGWNTGGDVGFGTFSASLCGLARSMAVELASGGVTVNSILPMLDVENTEHVMETIPLDLLPDGMDVGGAALFLASRQASFITGYGLDINCGLFMD